MSGDDLLQLVLVEVGLQDLNLTRAFQVEAFAAGARQKQRAEVPLVVVLHHLVALSLAELAGELAVRDALLAQHRLVRVQPGLQEVRVDQRAVLRVLLDAPEEAVARGLELRALLCRELGGHAFGEPSGAVRDQPYDQSTPELYVRAHRFVEQSPPNETHR
jgi:hypothetical protein